MRYLALSSLFNIDSLVDRVAMHGTSFLEFLNQLLHCIIMWHLGLQKLCPKLLNILLGSEIHDMLGTYTPQQIILLSQQTTPVFLAILLGLEWLFRPEALESC